MQHKAQILSFSSLMGFEAKEASDLIASSGVICMCLSPFEKALLFCRQTPEETCAEAAEKRREKRPVAVSPTRHSPLRSQTEKPPKMRVLS
jgi:hypothetical protein